jgi:flagellar protein FlbT
MSNLVLELRQGETMVVNGAPIRFRTKCRIELTGHARFLFGKQIMPPDQANSPARRIYFALQTAYIGTEEERPRGLHAARALVAEFQASTTSALACQILDRAMTAAEADDCFAALKLVRRIVQHEDAVLGRPPTAPSGRVAANDTAPCSVSAAVTHHAAPPPQIVPPAAIPEIA